MSAAELQRRRVHYLDPLRSILMMLGVVIHTASLYGSLDPKGSGDQGSIAFDWMVTGIHAFRMPAFFLVFGFFCQQTLDDKGEQALLRSRFRRIGIPFVSTLLIVNPWIASLQREWVGTDSGWHYSFADGSWLIHLWFLDHLLIYCVLIFLAARLVRLTSFGQVALRLVPSGPVWWPVNPAVLVLALPIVHMLLLRISWRLGATQGVFLAGLVNLPSLAKYLPFVVAGMVMARHERARQALHSWRFWGIGASTALVVSSVAAAMGTLGTYVIEYNTFLWAWALSGCCFFAARHLLDAPSPVWRYLSDASYTVYLLHQLFVVAFALAIVDYPLDLATRFVLVTLVGFLASLVVHHVMIRTSPLLGYLFNGQVGRGQRAVRPLSMQPRSRPTGAAYLRP